MPSPIAHIDIETRSNVNLFTHGVYTYAQDLSTELLCLSYAIDNAEVQTWTPHSKRPFPADLATHIEHGRKLYAHNAQFERLLFEYVVCNDYDCPRPALEQWYCTATLARAHALPGALDKCARVLGLDFQKDKRGAELIKLMSVPPFQFDEQLLAEMVAYCEQDVRVERAIHDTLPALPAGVWAGYHVSERINDRGILVDTEIAEAAIPLASEEQLSINEALSQATFGEVLKPRSTKLTNWVYERLPEAYKAYMHDPTKKSGLSLDSARVEEMLALEGRLDSSVLRVLELKALSSKSSVAKFESLIKLADPDDKRVRGAFIYLGAAQTGRWSSKGLQVHNLPRVSVSGDEFDALRSALITGRLRGDVMRSLSSLLRPSIMASAGKELVSVDWSGIEARALPWLTAFDSAEPVLNVFRSGKDIYLETASSMGPQYDRQIGKVATLSLGYGGGVGAFKSMAGNYRVKVSDDVAQRVVNDWRTANPWAKSFWQALEKGVATAMQCPDKWVEVSRVAYLYDGTHLFCRLPSGRQLMYPYATREVKETRYGPQFAYSCVKSSLVTTQTEDFPRMWLWGGLLAENITQAVCADLLVDLLLWLEDERAEYPVIMHVHDQVVLEVPEGKGAEVVADIEDAMRVAPWWAEGLPLDAEGWHGQRFRK